MIWLANLTISDADRLTLTLEPARSTNFRIVISVKRIHFATIHALTTRMLKSKRLKRI